MSRNLYLGADTSLVLGSFLDGPDDLEGRAREVLHQLQANDFRERGPALVNEIQEAAPHLVAMQEVVEVRHRTPDRETVIDYLAILEDILQARDLPYGFVAPQPTTVADLEIGSGERLTFTDRLALLVRRDVPIVAETRGRYSAIQPTPVGITLQRGWVAVDCEIGGSVHHVANTHLEVQAFPDCQASQLEELLLEVLPPDTGSTFLMGDFNANAEGQEGDPTWTPAYDVVGAAGFQDLWAAHRGGTDDKATRDDPGYTCCHDADLSHPGNVLDQRIDFIFHRGRPAPEILDVRRVGADPSARSGDPGLWPSDHAGVVASVEIPKVSPTSRSSG